MPAGNTAEQKERDIALDEEAPLFSKNRDYIERLVYPEREEADLSAPA